MTTPDLVDYLLYVLADAKKEQFGPAVAYQLLNVGIEQVMNKLDPYFLTELEHLEENLTATDGVLDLSDLSYGVAKGQEGVLKVRINGGVWCNMIDFKDIKKYQSRYRAGTTRNPLAYVNQEKIYLQPETTTSIDVLYLKVPGQLTAHFDTITAEWNSPPVLGSEDHFMVTSTMLDRTADFYSGCVCYWSPDSGYDQANYTPGYRVVVGTEESDGLGGWHPGSVIFEVSPGLDPGYDFENGRVKFFMWDLDSLDDLEPFRSDFNKSFRSIILDFAAAMGWKMDGNLELSAAWYKSAISKIEMINSVKNRSTR